MTAPVPKRVEMRREHHDDVFIDHYEWMRDKSDPEVIAHLEAENAHVEDETSYQEPLRQQIFDEIKARTKETDLSVPIRLEGGATLNQASALWTRPKGEVTDERKAVDAVARGDLDKAIELYSALAKAHPDEPAYAAAVEILQKKKGAR